MVSVSVSSGMERVHHARWNDCNSICVPGSLLAADFQNEVQVLDTNTYTSVSDALLALNNGVVEPASFFFVFSKRKGAFYLLWPSEATADEAKDLIARLSLSLAARQLREEQKTYNLKDSDLGSNENRRTADISPQRTRTQISSPERARQQVSSPERKVLERKAESSLVETSHDRSRTQLIAPKGMLTSVRSSPNLGENKSAKVLPPPRAVVENLSTKQTGANFVERTDSKVLSSPSDTACDISPVRLRANFVERSTSNVVPSPRDAIDRQSSSPERRKLLVSPDAIDGQSSSPERRRLLVSPRIRVDDTSLEQTRDESDCKNVSSPRDTIFGQSRSPERRRVLVSPRSRVDTSLEQTRTRDESFCLTPRNPQSMSKPPASSLAGWISPRRPAAQSASEVQTPNASKPSVAVLQASRASQPSKASLRFANGKDVNESPVDFEMKEIPFVGTNTTMTIEDLHMDKSDFDPNRPQLKSQLLSKLGLPTSAVIESLGDNAGSFNDGVWFVNDSAAPGLVLKLVPRLNHAGRKTDTEKCIELQKRCPRIASDLSFTFPVKIFQLRGPSGNRCNDLHVMRQAPGFQITQHLYYKFHGEQTDFLLTMCEKFGRFMRGIHRVHTDGKKSMQHGDCQPSNVFYDEVSDSFTLVDVADFGFGPFLAQGGENDVEHFVDGLCSLKTWYGRSLMDGCAQKFRQGYNEDINRL